MDRAEKGESCKGETAKAQLAEQREALSNLKAEEVIALVLKLAHEDVVRQKEKTVKVWSCLWDWSEEKSRRRVNVGEIES